MGLLSGRKNDPAVGAPPAHRYETRSRGGVFSSNNGGPGTAAGVSNTNSGGGLFGRKNKNAVPVNSTGTTGGVNTGRTGVGGAGLAGPGAPGAANNSMYPGSGTHRPSQPQS